LSRLEDISRYTEIRCKTLQFCKLKAITLQHLWEAFIVIVAGFLRGVVILVKERGKLIYNEPFQNRQQTLGGVFLSHHHKSSLISKKLSKWVFSSWA
jgi:hypothetical protein